MKLVNINKITNNALKKNQFNKSKYTLCKTFNLKDLINVKKNDIFFLYIYIFNYSS